MKYSSLLLILCLTLSGCHRNTNSSITAVGHVFPTPGRTREVLISSNGYKIAPPPGWHISPKSKKFDLMLGSAPTVNPIGNISVDVRNLRAGVTLETVAKLEDAHIQTLPNFYILSRGKTDLSGEPAQYRIFNMTAGKHDQACWMHEVFAIRGRKVFFLRFLALWRAPDVLAPDFDGTLKSFRWQTPTQSK